MKRVVILLVVLILIPFSSAKVIEIQDLFQIGDQPEILLDSEGEFSYFYTGDALIASKKGSSITFLYKDRLGSKRLDSEDNEFKSLPFGQELINSGNRFEFTGKEFDESSGLHYFNARYYDASVGRFTKIDPIPGEPPYSYVANNPMNYLDPSGTEYFGSENIVDSETGDLIMPMVDHAEFMKVQIAKHISSRYIDKSYLRDFASLSEAKDAASQSGYTYPRGLRYARSPYGLIDVESHVMANPAGDIIDKVLSAYQNGLETGQMQPFEVGMGNSEKSIRYSLTIVLDDSLLSEEVSRDKLMGIAFAIFTQVSHGFELYQSQQLPPSGHFFSGYAEEDFRSNYLSFFIAANELEYNDALWALGVVPIESLTPFSILGSEIDEKSFGIFKGLNMGSSKEWPTNFPSWVTDNMPEADHSFSVEEVRRD